MTPLALWYIDAKRKRSPPQRLPVEAVPTFYYHLPQASVMDVATARSWVGAFGGALPLPPDSEWYALQSVVAVFCDSGERNVLLFMADNLMYEDRPGERLELNDKAVYQRFSNLLRAPVAPPGIVYEGDLAGVRRFLAEWGSAHVFVKASKGSSRDAVARVPAPLLRNMPGAELREMLGELNVVQAAVPTDPLFLDMLAVAENLETTPQAAHVRVFLVWNATTRKMHYNTRIGIAHAPTNDDAMITTGLSYDLSRLVWDHPAFASRVLAVLRHMAAGLASHARATPSRTKEPVLWCFLFMGVDVIIAPSRAYILEVNFPSLEAAGSWPVQDAIRLAFPEFPAREDSGFVEL